MNCRSVSAVGFVCLCLSFAPASAEAQHQSTGATMRQSTSGSGAGAAVDPGPRGGTPGAGGPISGLSSADLTVFNNALAVFAEVESVSGKVPGEAGSGLGPTFNGNGCAQCHAEPAMGGSSPGLTSPQHSVPNPQVDLATLDGAGNAVPPFITPDGPVREARFVRNPDGSPDGGVHGLYTIAGRTDAPGCTLAQPNFGQQVAAANVIFRIPTPAFGLGLVEATPDATLQANLTSNAGIKFNLGIRGKLNTSGNDGTVTRFGWKAQNKSLIVFAGEAYNVEQGVSNELFPNERSAVPGCVFNGTPEDATNLEASGTANQVSSDLVNFATFIRFLAPPAPAAFSASAQNGANLFDAVGCALCHTPALTTGTSRYSALSHVTYNPYSDFALHHMGQGLADGVAQGAAGPDQFRTAPLWGLGQRLFLLHDGRTADLQQAIRAHASRGSEANTVIQRFGTLSQSQVQDLLNFLRSL